MKIAGRLGGGGGKNGIPPIVVLIHISYVIQYRGLSSQTHVYFLLIINIYIIKDLYIRDSMSLSDNKK